MQCTQLRKRRASILVVLRSAGERDARGELTVATVVASIEIPSGASSATFTISTQLVGSPVDVTIRASLGDDAQEGILRVVPPGNLAAVEIAPSSTIGGEDVRGSVSLVAPALAPVDVTLSSSDSAAVVPRTLTIPAGAAAGTFTIRTSVVASRRELVISATLGTESRTISLRLDPRPLETFFAYESAPGDAIGLGRSERRTPPADPIAADVLCSQNWVVVRIGPFERQWGVEFSAPWGQRLTPGSYGIRSSLTPNSTGPGLSVSGNGRGCTKVSGSFEITEAVYGSSNNVERFRATFQQQCDGGPPLRGEISLMSVPRVNRFTACIPPPPGLEAGEPAQFHPR